MKNRSIITITNHRSSKSYSIHRTTKIIIGVIFGILAIVFISNIVGTIWLKNEIVELRIEKISLNKEISLSRKQNSSLSKRIALKNNELGELEKIEKMIGLDKNDLANYSVRINTAKHNIVERNFLLSSIPSGSPFKYNAVITSTYGMRMHPIRNRMYMHFGVDYRAKIGTPIYATANGVVKFVGHNSGFGKTIKLWHNFGFTVYYAHLSKYAVKKGDFVKKGDLLGYTGNSGISTGPHLHYEIRFLKSPVNPNNFIKWSLSNYDIVFKTNKIKWSKLLSTVYITGTSLPIQ
jgi:murein DD-endopeptidase MepM/ murein hydrolase activator NlpD